MKTILFLAFALAAPAQIAATVFELTSGGYGIRVQNNGPFPFAALAVAYKLAGQESGHVVYFDELTDDSPPKQKLEILPPVAVPKNAKKSDYPVISDPAVIAAIFGDGSTTGDSALIRRLVIGRCNMMQAVENSLEMIADAGRHNISRARMIADFKRMAVSTGRWYVPQEQRVGARVYQSIVEKLINLQESQLGVPFPPNEFVQQETARLNRQRAVLMASQPSLADAGGYSFENANPRP